jgi:hypothetical protein
MQNHGELPYNRELLVKKPREGIVHLLKVTKEKFGFDGFLGLCAGNKLLENIGIEAAKAQPVEQTDIDFLTFMQQATGDRSVKDVMEEWNRLNPKKPSVVSVGDESTASTITHAPDTPVSCASEIIKLPIIHRVLLPFLNCPFRCKHLPQHLLHSLSQLLLQSLSQLLLHSLSQLLLQSLSQLCLLQQQRHNQRRRRQKRGKLMPPLLPVRETRLWIWRDSCPS